MAATTYLTSKSLSPRIARMKQLFEVKRETQDRIQNLTNNLGSLNRLAAIVGVDLMEGVAANYQLTERSLDSERAFLATVTAEIKAMHAEQGA
jgi:p-aminobenzoyl-glutamate transporter AbgT